MVSSSSQQKYYSPRAIFGSSLAWSPVEHDVLIQHDILEMNVLALQMHLMSIVEQPVEVRLFVTHPCCNGNQSWVEDKLCTSRV
jgi:hypothetical protein